jgi:3-deoxy-manno-octulosonate cytidylyltransferase (CMP-KDO synthetase)
MAKTLIVIPARYASTRLEKKMLLAETGKPLIQHTYEAASRSKRGHRVIVATDHPEIAQTVKQFGGEACMTDPAAQSGTDRIAEVAEHFPDAEFVVNVQGDEPDIDPEAIDLAIEILENDESAVMSTLATPIRSPELLEDPAAVKVVIDQRGNALYFSRSPIPYPRNIDLVCFEDPKPTHFLHLGLYVYRREFLLAIPQLNPSLTEKIESLEQLRVLDNGHRIKVGVIPQASGGIDTAEDYEAFVRRHRN